MLGDRAYDSAELRQWLSERGTKPVVPNKSNRKQPFRFDKKSYKQRHRIENAFCRLKDFRRIATRYDRLARNFLASVCLVAAIVWWILFILALSVSANVLSFAKRKLVGFELVPNSTKIGQGQLFGHFALYPPRTMVVPPNSLTHSATFSALAALL